jgi:flagellar hook-associated protein 1 FlgK
VTGVRRLVDSFVLGDLRLADAAVAGQEARLTFMTRLDPMIGAGGGEAGLSSRIARLQAALTEASNRPDSNARLGAVLSEAAGLAGHLNAASDQIQSTRMEADKEIGQVVTKLNADLGLVRDLNVQIRALAGSGRDTGGLVDQRQNLIDQISAVIPLREVQRDFGQVALVSSGGAMLLDGTPAEFGFAPVGVITPDMTLQSGALSGLTLNGSPLTVAGGRVDGGRLGALFDQRDGLAVEAQSRIDAVARDLYERFADPAVDPTIAGTDPGLFTDSGGAFLAADEVGLAGRLRINAAVDPAAGGAVWRLRAGLSAAAPNDPGDGTLLRAMTDALEAARSPASGPFAGQPRSAGALADELGALWNAETQALETTLSYSSSRADALRTLHLQDGVDTDQEMQKLLLIEQAYAANARVISTVDQMIQTLIGL